MSLNGVPFFSIAHLHYVLSGYRPGTDVRIEISRNEKTLELAAQLAPVPSSK